MTSMKARRIVTGLVLLCGGLVFGMMAILIFNAAQDAARLQRLAYQHSDATCREQVLKLGPIIELRDGELWDLRLTVVNDPRRALGDASAAIAACPTRAMEKFCLGIGCIDREAVHDVHFSFGQHPPISMTMRLAIRRGLVVAAPVVAPAAPTAATPVPAHSPAGGVAPRPTVPQRAPPRRF